MNLLICVIIENEDNIKLFNNFDNYIFFSNNKKNSENIEYIQDLSHFSIFKFIQDNNRLTDFIFVCYDRAYININNLLNYILTLNPLKTQYIGGHGDIRKINDEKFYFHSHSPGVLLTKSLIESLLNYNIDFMTEYNNLCFRYRESSIHNCSGVALGWYVKKYNYEIVFNNNIWFCNCNGSPCHPGIPNKKNIISCYNMTKENIESYCEFINTKVEVNHDMKIYIYPQGGLGNILFQYFLGCALKEKYKSEIYYLINTNYWRGDINNYSIFQHLDFIDSKDKILNKNQKHNESNYYYEEINLNANYNYTIEGYYQSYKYFIDVIDNIKNDLFFNNNNNLYNVMIDFYNNIKLSTNKQTCLIHVRRGDYLKHPTIHPVCSDNYYTQAIKLIPNNKYLIFSDDLEFIKKWVILKDIDHFIVEENNSEKTLILMSLCDNFIIANSTLSLAAYYLRNNKNAKIVAPKKWFGPSGYSFKIDDIVDPETSFII